MKLPQESRNPRGGRGRCSESLEEGRAHGVPFLPATPAHASSQRATLMHSRPPQPTGARNRGWTSAQKLRHRVQIISPVSSSHEWVTGVMRRIILCHSNGVIIQT